MDENQKTNIDAKSREFSRGVQAGLKSEDTKLWQAGYELGHELSEGVALGKGQEINGKQPDAPLFLADTLDGHQGNAQDEKDKTAE